MRAALPLFLIGLSLQGLAADKSPIVRTGDPFAVTHKFKIREITFGFSALGGGYLNHVDLGDGKNIVSANYGRGWQGSLRDKLHSGRYNPTQAGFNDTAGTPVELLASEHSLVIPKFTLPLYGDPVFDFTEHEELVPDFKGYKDNGSSDTDGLEEAALTQDDELRSEFDFEGVYEDASALGGGTIPVLRFYSRYSYVRPPRAIRQFGKRAVLADGNPVINESTRVRDISPAFAGNQPATDDDLSGVIFTAYGIRLLTESGYTTPMWFAGGKWQSLPVEAINGRGKEKQFLLQGSPSPVGLDLPLQTLDSDFLVLAKGENPLTSPAIALYTPSWSEINTYQILGITKDKVVYREDRRTANKILFSQVIPTQVDMRSRLSLTGMLAPGHGQANVIEALQNETFVLFGTPDQILATVGNLQRKFGGYAPAARMNNTQ